MPGSGRYLNWDNVSFAIQGGAAVPIRGVTSLDINPNSKSIAGAGDGDMMPTTRTQTEEDPSVTIEFEGLAALLALHGGVRGTLTATRMDAENGLGAGAITYTIVNCMIENGREGGAYRTYGKGTLDIRTWSTDGRTSPISTSVAA